MRVRKRAFGSAVVAVAAVAAMALPASASAGGGAGMVSWRKGSAGGTRGKR
jgi:hypothetical protein